MSAQIKELVTLAKNGDAEAFGELYELYYKDKSGNDIDLGEILLSQKTDKMLLNNPELFIEEVNNFKGQEISDEMLNTIIQKNVLKNFLNRQNRL